jgi:hypothetical protein
VPEFTGERVIPGEVDVDLFNEHVAWYRIDNAISRQRTRSADVRLGVAELESPRA